MMGKKRSQVSVFIVIVLIFVILLILFLSMRQYDMHSGSYEANYDARVVKSYLDNCIDIGNKEVLVEFGRQGSMIEMRDPYLMFTLNNITTNISLLYYEGDVTLGTLREWEGNLSDAIEDSALACLDADELSQYNLNNSMIDITVTAIDKHTKVEVELPVQATTADGEFQIIEPYTYIYEVNLIYLYDDVLGVMIMHYFDPYAMDFKYLTELNTSIDFTAYNDTIVYTIAELNSNMNDMPYIFNFAAKFNHTWMGDPNAE